MPQYIHRTRIEAPARDVFDWHKRPGAFERLQPPWETVEIVERTGGIQNGDRVTLRTRLGPLWTNWVIEHRDYIEGVQFRDIQISGPFKQWEHTHRILPDGENACILEDDITYVLPMGLAGRTLGTGFVDAKLRRMFEYRHAVTQADIPAHQAGRARGPMRILVSGASGLLGTHLLPLLTTGGHEVIRLSRHRAAGSATWNVDTGSVEVPDTAPIDAVVHLAGENIASRWSTAAKQRIRDSRINGTRQLAEWIRRIEMPPRVFLCASAIGYYGNRGDEMLTEQSAPGRGFLADVCADWETAAAIAKSDTTRVVNLRFGVILSPRGGALAKMLTPFRLGAGGVVGDGRQYWSWISIDDAAGAMLHALQCDDLDGPANVVAPQPVSNREFTKSLGAVLRRPTVAPMPAFAARIAFGEMADELLLSSQRVIPERLIQTGYVFRQPRLPTALGHLLGGVVRPTNQH